METPVSTTGLRMYDHLPPVAAALTAWREPGRDPAWHQRARRVVQTEAPQLAAALEAGDETKVGKELRRAMSAGVRSAMPLIGRAADRLRG